MPDIVPSPELLRGIIFPWLPIIFAFTLAVLTPVIVIMVRHEIRLRRIRLIDEFSKNFGANGEVLSDRSGGTQLRHTPSFEFVKSKYSVDLDRYPDDIDPKKLRDLDLNDPAVDQFLSKLRWYSLRSNRRLLWASVPYFLFCFAGFFLALSPITSGSEGPGLQPSIFTSGGIALNADTAAYFEQVETIVAISFVAAYIYTLRLFTRAVAAFDLNSVTLLRATAHIIMSVATVVVLWRALPDPTAVDTWLKPPSNEAGIAKVWLLLAFLLGFVPDAAMNFAFGKISQIWKAFKTTDERFTDYTKSVPLEVIDGIDFFTRFRLEESSIYEVQNLAVANPIMLTIETPYGIYQTIDWVAQAQLCTVVGPERFLQLRHHNIRTIFDLERAVLSEDTTSQLRRFVASLLLLPTQTARDMAYTTKSTYIAIGDAPGTKLDSDEFDAFKKKLFESSNDAADPDGTIKHLVRVIVDDLHVHRLRQVWQSISISLGEKSAQLADTETPPTVAKRPLTPHRDPTPRIVASGVNKK